MAGNPYPRSESRRSPSPFGVGDEMMSSEVRKAALITDAPTAPRHQRPTEIGWQANKKKLSGRCKNAGVGGE